MKPVFGLLIIVFSFFSCIDKNDDDFTTPGSSLGAINSLSVIVDNDLWNGEVGDTIRKKLATPVDGLPQEEPLFTLNQYPVNLFEGTVKKNRNIVVIKKGNITSFKHSENVFANPQQVFYITATSNEGLVKLLEQQSGKIIQWLKKSEILENQSQIKKSSLSDQFIQQRFNVKMAIPNNYKYELLAKKFLWIRRELPTGYNSLLVYDVPISTIENNNTIVSNIIAVRDSLGKRYIHGALGSTWMITETAYSPYFLQTQIDHKIAFETKGSWQLKDDFMAGPFINYAIKDEKNKRYLILDGFTYNPSKAKRDLVFELESIMKSVTFTP